MCNVHSYDHDVRHQVIDNIVSKIKVKGNYLGLGGPIQSNEMKFINKVVDKGTAFILEKNRNYYNIWDDYAVDNNLNHIFPMNITFSKIINTCLLKNRKVRCINIDFCKSIKSHCIDIMKAKQYLDNLNMPDFYKCLTGTVSVRGLDCSTKNSVMLLKALIHPDVEIYTYKSTDHGRGVTMIRFFYQWK